MSKTLESGKWSIQQAEIFFLGQLLAYPEKLMDVEVAEEYFTIQSHRKIFRKIMDLESRNKMIDVITVSDELEKEYPGEYWLVRLGSYQMDSFSSTFFESAQIVMVENFRKREIKRISTELANDFDSDRAIRALMNIDTSEKNYTHTIGEAAIAAIEEAQETAAKDGLSGLPTGLKKMDDTTGGFHDSDFIVLAGRPGTGKTSVAINLMLAHNVPVAFFSTEQPYKQIGLRAVSAYSAVSAQKIRVANFDDNDMEAMSAACTQLTNSKIHIYDKGQLTISELMRESRRLKYNHDIKAIYVDYIQRMKVESKDRREGLGDIVRGMKSLAKELDVPIIALAQVNREVEKRTDKKPRMGDLKESGDIEQEADVVMFLYRDEQCYPQSGEKGTIEILIDKNRHGPVGQMKFAWIPETMQIKDRFSS